MEEIELNWDLFTTVYYKISKNAQKVAYWQFCHVYGDFSDEFQWSYYKSLI